jgi:hypothetical protein
MTAQAIERPSRVVPASPLFATARTPGRRSDGRAIGVLAASMGRPLAPWQQLVADVATERLDDGSWAYQVVVVTVPRQSGKTTLITPFASHRCLICPDALTWYTAQTRQDARDNFGEAVKLLKRSPLRPPRTKVRLSNGSEGVTYPGGATWRVFAPTPDALHGKANEQVTVDEAWAFDGVRGLALEQAILPTFTTDSWSSCRRQGPPNPPGCCPTSSAVAQLSAPVVARGSRSLSGESATTSATRSSKG